MATPHLYDQPEATTHGPAWKVNAVCNGDINIERLAGPTRAPVRDWKAAHIKQPSPGLAYSRSLFGDIFVTSVAFDRIIARLGLAEATSIRSFFDPEAIAAMSEALEAALEKLGDIGQPEVVREIIAGRIIAAAKLGERDPARLLEAALRKPE